MTKPITPNEATAAKISQIPDKVFEAFNELIAKDFTGRSATVSQDDAVDLIVEKMHCTRDKIFDEQWLDVEAAYDNHGWHVAYESYPAAFTFKKKDTSTL